MAGDAPGEPTASAPGPVALPDVRGTAELGAAFEALDARAHAPRDTLSFEEKYPPAAEVDRWFEAAFVHSALSCVGDAPPRLAREHAFTLLVQARRGWGWDADRDDARARAALVAALVSDWDLVAEALGGRPLARTVSRSASFSALGGYVRHVATAAKNRLGEGACADALRSHVALPDARPAISWALARVAIELAGGHPRAEVPARFAAILAGEQPARRAPAPLVDDPQVSVFERYMHLGSAEEREQLEEWLEYIRDERGMAVWDSHVAGTIAHASVLGMDDLLATALPAIAALRTGSTTYPVPALAFLAMLGMPVLGWEAAMRADLKRFHRPTEVNALRRWRWSTGAAAVALAAGDTALVRKLTPATGGDRFRPGRAFGDDPRAVLRHYALALDAGASLRDVEPAWAELLVTRPPDGDDSRTGGAWGWESLWCLALAHFSRIGGARPEEVPLLLRRTLRGA